MTADVVAYAPAGWGFHPGIRIDTPTAADLPDIPDLPALNGRARNNRIVAAIRSRYGLASAITAMDVSRRYGIPYVAAWEIYQRCL